MAGCGGCGGAASAAVTQVVEAGMQNVDKSKLIKVRYIRGSAALGSHILPSPTGALIREANLGHYGLVNFGQELEILKEDYEANKTWFEPVSAAPAAPAAPAADDLTTIDGVGTVTAQKLIDAGHDTFAEVKALDKAALEALGIASATADKIVAWSQAN